MPGPVIPIIIAAGAIGARVAAGQAAKQLAKQGAKQVAKRKVGAARKTPSKYKKKEIGNPLTQNYSVRTKAAAKKQAQRRSVINQKVKSNIKSGNTRPLPQRRGSYGRLGPNVARMNKAPVKPSKARRGPNNPKRRKR